MLVGADDDLTPRSVDDERVPRSHRSAQTMHADHERDLERLQDDCRVRSLAPVLGGESSEARAAQMQGIDGRQRNADSDRAWGGSPGRHLRKPEEGPQETVADSLDVRASLAQVRIFHSIELRADRIDDPAHRRFGPDLLLLDQAARTLDDGGVTQHQPVRFDDEVSLVQLLGFQTRRETSELCVGGGHRLAKTGDLGGHQVGRNPSIDHCDAGCEQPRLPDGDAVRGWYAS